MNRHPRMLCSALVLMLIASVGCVPDGTACASSPGACAADASAMSTGGAGLDGGSGQDGSAGSSGGGVGGTGGSGGLGGAGAAAGSSSGGDGGDGGGPDSGCAECSEDRPHCREGECVECTEAEHCASGVCFLGACVDCRVSGDCKAATASRCTEARECAACEVDADCGHLDQRVCDEGVCVECTAEDSSGCGLSGTGSSYVCDVLNRTCSTSVIRRSAGLCEACVSDEQCGTGQLCVMQRFNEPGAGEQDVGYFCFYREDATQPNGSCANVPPFFSTLAASTSISGAQATVCGLAVTTCPAYLDFRSTPCTGSDDDASCGDSRFSDGVCEMFTSGFRCTTPCLSTDDCKAGSTCSATVPSFCSL